MAAPHLKQMNLVRSVAPQVTKMLETVIIIAHLVVAIAIVGFVLIQQGKGAEAGASFGSGASATVFGAQGTGNFFSRLTAILAAVFFATSLGLAYYAKQQSKGVDDLGLPPAVQEISNDAALQENKTTDVPQLETKESSEDSIPQLD